MSTPRELARKMAEKSDQELRAMFESPGDWMVEALDAAKAELQKRGLSGAGKPLDIEPEWPVVFDDDRPDIYECFGAYPNDDARLLLDAFARDEVRFTLNADKMGMDDMPAFQAAKGGTFGAGVGITIGVHIDDLDRAMAIRQRVLKILP